MSYDDILKAAFGECAVGRANHKDRFSHGDLRRVIDTAISGRLSEGTRADAQEIFPHVDVRDMSDDSVAIALVHEIQRLRLAIDEMKQDELVHGCNDEWSV